MRAKAVRVMDEELKEYFKAAEVSIKRMKNIRRNLKRLITRSPLPTKEAFYAINKSGQLNRLLERSGWWL